MGCQAKETNTKSYQYQDAGCSSHMCEDKEALFELDAFFGVTVKFGDNSPITGRKRRC